jgi:predicted nicotinamide N-methyase
VSDDAHRYQFILAETVLASAVLVPEIALRLAADSHGIFQSAEAHDIGAGWPPYWAFAWPGGQALARYILDHPAIVRGKSVLDVGAGSGIASIASAMSGAARTVAADPDPLAAMAMAINARHNKVEFEVAVEDLLASEPEADLVLIADLVYEPELATRVTRFLEWARGAGVDVIMADRASGRRPPVSFSALSHYQAPLTPALEDGHLEQATIWRLSPAEGSAARRSLPARQ